MMRTFFLLQLNFILIIKAPDLKFSIFVSCASLFKSRVSPKENVGDVTSVFFYFIIWMTGKGKKQNYYVNILLHSTFNSWNTSYL